MQACLIYVDQAKMSKYICFQWKMEMFRL